MTRLLALVWPDLRLPEAETAASEGHTDNPTLANEFIFDWISNRLERIAVQTRNAHDSRKPRSDRLRLV